MGSGDSCIYSSCTDTRQHLNQLCQEMPAVIHKDNVKNEHMSQKLEIKFETIQVEVVSNIFKIIHGEVSHSNTFFIYSVFAVFIFLSFPFPHANILVSPPEDADTVFYWCPFLGIDFMVFYQIRGPGWKEKIYM